MNKIKLKTIWKNIKGFCCFMFFIFAAIIFFTNFLTFVLAGGQDALALAWMAFAGLYMHEHKHVKREDNE